MKVTYDEADFGALLGVALGAVLGAVLAGALGAALGAVLAGALCRPRSRIPQNDTKDKLVQAKAVFNEPSFEAFLAKTTIAFQETESTLFAKEHGIAASAEEIKKAWPQNHREHVVLLLDERDSMQARIAALTALVTARESEITEVLKELKELRRTCA